MNRYTWLILSVIALFGLRAPLCVFACFEADSTAQVASAEQPVGASLPCHDSGAAAPEKPASGDPGCDCDTLKLVLTGGNANKTFFATFAVTGLPTGLRSLAVPSPSISFDHPWDRRPSLPSTDILLLKSTLLI